MPADRDRAQLDRPWHRPGATAYAVGRLRGLLRPPVTVTPADPDEVLVERDVAVPVRDGTVLRVNVYRPTAVGSVPVLLCAHPYGKDRLPRRGRRGYRVPLPYRVLRQTGPVALSDETGWEAPDPAWWTAHGYALVNADLRGAGTSGGTAALLSRGEADDVHDLVQWAGAQRWSTGAVGMLGVSYLALTQWGAAATRPSHLRAICPWEGFTDAYRDLVRPGGVREDGFLRLWTRSLRGVRTADDLRRASRDRPLYDDWWRALVPDLARIDVPVLVCGSFSDNALHSRGSFRGFREAGSADRFLWTHRSGKWATFSSAPARAAQLGFFDRYLKGSDLPAPPTVRLEVRESRDEVVAVRAEDGWPLARTQWTPLHLSHAGLQAAPPAAAGSLAFDTRRSGARFGWTVPEETELTGPMALRLWVSVEGADDVDLFAGVEKWRGPRYVGFEGSYGFGRDRVTTGWQQASLRALDSARSRPYEPVPLLTHRRPLRPAEVVQVDLALGPSATLFRAGEQLRLVVAGRWLWPTNPLTGQFPAAYPRRPPARCTLHWGPDRPARLLVPVVPAP